MRAQASMALPALLALLLAPGAQGEGQTGAAQAGAVQRAQAESGRSDAPSGQLVIDPRPEDPTANLPSDSGAQTELPSGAVTGAGLAHGTIPHPDLGMPGGLEERARAKARAEAMREGWSAIEPAPSLQKGPPSPQP